MIAWVLSMYIATTCKLSTGIPYINKDQHIFWGLFYQMYGYSVQCTTVYILLCTSIVLLYSKKGDAKVIK